METFSIYRSLFSDAIRNDMLDFCTWNPKGRTIDEALPDIRELTDGRKDWTAVVVCNAMNGSRRKQDGIQNPYDVFRNEPENASSESSDPVIRLTHMLGGIPPAEKQFTSKLIEEPLMQPRVVYEPVEDPEQQDAYRALQKKYEYDGVRPTTIMLISVRMPWMDEEDISKSWKNHVESRSSEFWKRNRYPAICRFLVFDFVRQGPVRREADMFRFWLTVMLLATNKIDSSSLQAYRLYEVDTEIDLDQMEESFQLAVNRISSARAVIKSDLRKEARGFINQEAGLPDYRIDIPVVFDLPRSTKTRIKPGLFRIISRNPASEIAMWDEEQKRTEDSLAKSVRIADRALDQTANRMKDAYIYDESEVIRLDRYQREDLELETDTLYKEIVEIQGKLPSGQITEDKEVEEKSARVREYMRGRVTLKPVLQTFLICILLVIAAQIPVLVQYIKGEVISWTYVGLEVLTFIAAILISGLSILLVQKKKLDSLIGDFNRKIQSLFNRLENNAGEYTDYLSAVASHSRGRSYLDMSAKKNRDAGSARVMRYKHLSAIDLFMSRLRAWGEAFHLDVDYDRPVISDDVKVDVLIPPADNMLYSLETGGSFDIDVNKSGMKITTPFAFISKLRLVREEVYDDDSI